MQRPQPEAVRALRVCSADVSMLTEEEKIWREKERLRKQEMNDRRAEERRQKAIARGEDMEAWEELRLKKAAILPGEGVLHTCSKCNQRFESRPGTKYCQHKTGGCKGRCVNTTSAMKKGLVPPCSGC